MQLTAWFTFIVETVVNQWSCFPMSAEESECELQQLVSSDEENGPPNKGNVIASGSNTKPFESIQRPQTLHKVASDHSYRSSKVRTYIRIIIVHCPWYLRVELVFFSCRFHRLITAWLKNLVSMDPNCLATPRFRQAQICRLMLLTYPLVSCVHLFLFQYLPINLLIR